MVEIIRNGSKNGLLNAALMIIWATINTLPAPAQNPVSDRMHIFLSLIRHDYLTPFSWLKRAIVVPQIVAVNLCDIVVFRLFSAYSTLRILLRL